MGDYYKITNQDENHHGFQYHDGLNIDTQTFNDDPQQSCVGGGLYFTDAQHLFQFLDYGIYLRQVTLPTDNDHFQMIKDPSGDKWRTNMIILQPREDLWTINNITKFQLHKYVLDYASRHGLVNLLE